MAQCSGAAGGHAIKTAFLSILFMTLFLQAAACEEPALFRDRSSSGWKNEQAEFSNELSLSARKAVELARTRFSKIKNINDSYQRTSEAILLLAERGDVRGAIPLLREASEKFDGNRLAYLLLGAAYEKAGNREEAARAFTGFYTNSLTLMPEESELITPNGLRVFRSYVEARLAAWKMPVPEAKIGLILRRARSLVMLDGSPDAQRIHLLLTMGLLAGTLLFFLLRLNGIEFPHAVSYFLGSFYFLIILAYVFWAAHLFAGLPFFISPGIEYKLFLIWGTVLIAVFYAVFFHLGRNKKEKIEGARYCPYCSGVALNLATECPKCKRRIPG